MWHARYKHIRAFKKVPFMYEFLDVRAPDVREERFSNRRGVSHAKKRSGSTQSPIRAAVDRPACFIRVTFFSYPRVTDEVDRLLALRGRN